MASATSKLSPNATLCSNSIVQKIVPWSSGCFYKAYFEDNPTDEQLVFEKDKLDNFVNKKGHASDILWYRSVFHQRFQNRFKTSFKEIHEMHLDYTKAQHTRLDAQFDYLEFLYKSDLKPLAQTTLDRFCTTYVNPIGSPHERVEEIRWRISKKSLPLTTEKCLPYVSSP